MIAPSVWRDGSIRLLAGHDVYLKIDFAIVAWTPFV
jgi:hypothetical protein